MSRLQHKKGRKSNYVKRLVNNPDWEEAKRKVRIRDGHKCQMCGKDFNLEIHHKHTGLTENQSLVMSLNILIVSLPFVVTVI